MDELLNDFIAETADHLDEAGSQIVHFERDPSDVAAIAQIFRLVHTIKGTCGFLELSRLERLAHAAETLLARVREKGVANREQVSLILSSLDRIRFILQHLEATAGEPEGDDAGLIAGLEAAALGGTARADSFEAEVEAQPETQAALRAEVDDDVFAPVPLRMDLVETAGPAPTQARETIQPAQAAPVSPTPASPAASKEPSSIRVAVGTLERIMRLVSELVLTRNQLLEIARRQPNEEFSVPLQRLSSVTSDLQDGVMHARMQPIERLFGPLPRMIRDLAFELGKKAELVIDGADTELDRQMIDLLRDPLTHIIRNCLDHGIETPAERIAAGKPDAGTIRITASHEAGHITVRIADDGRGLDIQRILEKARALELGTEEELSRMGTEELCRYIFSAGFSTAKKVTNVSGRGVGMDVVRENIESIGGSVSLTTSPGRGTSFIMKVPLTLAIAPALIFEIAGARYAIAQHAVVEAVSCSVNGQSRIRFAQGAPMLELRDQLIPVADMRALFGYAQATPPDDVLAIVVRNGNSVFAMTVDAVADVQEIVVKPLDRTLAHLGVYAGSTILGDGSVVLILNPNGLASKIGLDGSNQFRVDTAPLDLPPEKTATTLILFRAGAGALKAVPLSLISRIENLAREAIRNADGQLVVTHRGQLMPLIALGDIAPNGVLGYPTREKWPVLVVGVGGEPMGLLVSEIVDIVDSLLDINIAGVTPAVIGSASILGEAAEVLDLAYYMKAARPGAFERGHAKRFRVMLVDDKQFFRDLLSPIISAAGYEVTAIASAEEGLAVFKRGFGYDVVITDVDMPGMDGYSFARTLRENPRTRDIPVIALDAHAGASVVEAADKAGMRGVIGKFDRQGLLGCLRNVLEASAFTASELEKRMSEEKAA